MLQIFVNQTVWCKHKNRHIEQESPEINLHIYGQLIFGRLPKAHNEGMTVSSVNGAEKTVYPQAAG